MKNNKHAHLVLADGAVFTGVGFGHATVKTGEVVFNTAMSGYQEVLTDPSYHGQIVVMTYPHIGNYGVCPPDDESKKIYASGLVVREYSKTVSNYRARLSIDDALKRAKVPGISEIDTRALVRHIREAGAMPAVLAIGGKYSLAELKKMARKIPVMDGQNLAKRVTCDKSHAWKKGVEPFVVGAGSKPAQNRGRVWNPPLRNTKSKKKFHVVAYDYGIKHNILRLLKDHGCDVTVVPYSYPAEKIMNSKVPVDGVFLSNGPGDPAACTEAVAAVKALLGKKPVFGICLGHQIIGQALGAKTYKLKFGHHGANHPVMDLTTKKVEITSQNHGYAVDDKSLPPDVEVTHLNLNDNTVEGLRHKTLPVFSVQYHPESAPGPHDSRYLFQRFIKFMQSESNSPQPPLTSRGG